MFHYIPASHLASSYSYSPSHLSNPRDRYFAALAEAKAAETDYLAAEAAQREEDELRRRLAEIQHRKQEQSLRSRYDLVPYNYLDTYPSYDRLAILQKQVEGEERLRLLALREAELEERRRREQAAIELEAVRMRQAREEALRLRQQEQRVQARLRVLLEKSAKVAEHQCSCGNQTSRPYCQIACHKPRKQTTPALAQVLFRPEAKVIPPAEPKRQAKKEDVVVEALRQILGLSLETSKPKASAPATIPQPESVPEPKTAEKPASKPSIARDEDVLDPQKYFEHIFKSIGLPLDQLQQPASQTTPSDESFGTHLFPEFAKLLVSPAAEETTSQPSASSSSSKPAQDAPAKAAPAASVPAPKAQTSNTPTQSLKEQLEARLNNEFHSEVRDTIQAIFESLLDADNHERSTTSSSKADLSSKGKAKANESSTTTTSVPSSNPTSKNVVDSLNEVRSFEAAFHALETDFIFPATLDFISSHLIPGSPVSSDSESSSATTHLAYTSRNHPVRFYEQALSSLLAQLDSVDSFGNDALRATRKEVVSRVEKALEELEKEVEGRYRTRLAKETKSVPIETTTTAPVVPTTTASATPDSKQDSTPAPEPKVEDPKESTSAPVVLSESAPTATSAKESSLDSSESSDSPSPIVPTSATEPEPAVLADIPTITDESSSLSSSSATVKGYEVQAETENTAQVTASPSVETESTDAFLLTTELEAIPKRPSNKDNDDVASDWSEVEA